MPDLWLQVQAGFQEHTLLYGLFLSIVALCLLCRRQLWIYWKFCYACFLKPVNYGNAADVKSLTGQQRALEGFYRTQAEIYDATRGRLLCGREDMLQLAAAQLKHRLSDRSTKPIWVDVGGGTGYNIEKMNDFFPVEEFSAVYLVDLSPSLCDVARARFAKLGWKNVHVVCDDARTFTIEGSDHAPVTTERGEADKKHAVKADFISTSYSLSMIPDFYSVIDSITDLLAPRGIISCVDFYVQSASSYSLRNFTGGHHSRHVNWLSRLFWRTWFQLDRVHLDEGRRDYLEHRFGTILNVNERNYALGGIPYYIWLGCQRTATSAGTTGVLAREAAERIDALATESPYLSPVRYTEKRAEAADAAAQATQQQLRSKGFEAAILNLSTNVPLPAFFYQNQRWRLYYDEALPQHTQFANEYIYAFAWEDPAEDERLLRIGADDVVLAITSAGDNVLAYAARRPRSVHAVDLNPAQNHLLELKLAALRALPHADVWALFGEGRHARFRSLLLDRLSPFLSSRALQFWLDRTATFTGRGSLYETGGTRIALKLCRALFALLGRTADVRALCAARTLREQRAIWRTRLRRVVLSRWLSYLVVANERFLWRALGVPPNQRDMIYHDALAAAAASGGAFDRKDAMWKYVVDTLDPVVENTLLKDDNYFYRLCLMGCYSKECHPEYLSEEAHRILSQPGALDGLRVHTDAFVEVLARIRRESVTIAVIMDHMDWFDPEGDQATNEINALNKAMKRGGRVLLRSAGLKPWYIANFSAQGFKCERVAARTSGKCVDRVNMYASTWICTKVGQDPSGVTSSEIAQEVTRRSDSEVVETLEL